MAFVGPFLGVLVGLFAGHHLELRRVEKAARRKQWEQWQACQREQLVEMHRFLEEYGTLKYEIYDRISKGTGSDPDTEMRALRAASP
jgi:hypothetical protein